MQPSPMAETSSAPSARFFMALSFDLKSFALRSEVTGWCCMTGTIR